MPARWILTCGRVLVALSLLGAAAPADLPVAVPPASRELYRELAQELSEAEALLAAQPEAPRQACPQVAPSLFLALSAWGPADAARWQRIETLLDAYQKIGFKAVSVMISFPALSSEMPHAAELLTFYQRLAQAIHQRGMKLLIEHFLLPPIPSLPAGRQVAHYRTLPDGSARFLADKKAELLTILTQIRPDYLTLMTEPETYRHFLGFAISPADYARLLTEVLRAAGPHPATRLGAGIGIWEDEAYLQAWAPLPLDYIDFHFYPLKLQNTAYFPKLLAWIDRLHGQNPRREIVISETWLYKHGALQAKGVYDTGAYASNVYDFWSPLDRRFFELMFALGRKKGLSLIAPYFPEAFFQTSAYASEQPLPAWPESLLPQWNQLLTRFEAGTFPLTDLGQAFAAQQICPPN